MRNLERGTYGHDARGRRIFSRQNILPLTFHDDKVNGMVVRRHFSRKLLLLGVVALGVCLLGTDRYAFASCGDYLHWGLSSDNAPLDGTGSESLPADALSHAPPKSCDGPLCSQGRHLPPRPPSQSAPEQDRAALLATRKPEAEYAWSRWFEDISCARGVELSESLLRPPRRIL